MPTTSPLLLPFFSPLTYFLFRNNCIINWLTVVRLNIMLFRGRIREEVRSQAARVSPCHRGSHTATVTARNIDCCQVTTKKKKMKKRKQSPPACWVVMHDVSDVFWRLNRNPPSVMPAIHIFYYKIRKLMLHILKFWIVPNCDSGGEISVSIPAISKLLLILYTDYINHVSTISFRLICRISVTFWEMLRFNCLSFWELDEIVDAPLGEWKLAANSCNPLKKV